MAEKMEAEKEGVSKGIARVYMTNTGRYIVWIKIEESRFTKYRFTMKKDYETGELIHELRGFDPETWVFCEADEEADITSSYEAVVDTYQEAIQRMQEILRKIGEQDKALAIKERKEEYEFRTTPNGDVEIQAKLPQ